MKFPSSFDLDPISSKNLYQFHTPDLVEKVRKIGNFEGALVSASTTVKAEEKIYMGGIEEAFVVVISVVGAIAIQKLTRRFGAKRFVIIDNDFHHGDGS